MHARLKQKYRIGIDARFFRTETGGIGRYSRELIHHLAALDGHNEYVVFLTEADIAEWTLQQANFKPVVVTAGHYTPAEQTVFLKDLMAQKLDLVHFLNFNHPILYPRPFVTTLHDLTMFFFPAGKSSKSRLRHQIFRYVFRRSLAAARKVIAISEYSANDAEKHLHISHAKMEVVYEGGPQVGEIPFGSKKVVMDYLGTKDPYFLFVSSWRPHKGILTMIDAFNEFKQKTGLPHKLVLVGKQTVLEEQVKEKLVQSQFASDIITPGFAPDELLPALYNHSYAFVMPSEYEGFGLPVLEAMACGTATIVANNSSLPEVGGDAALYFPTGDASKLAQTMEQLVASPELRQKQIEKALKQLQKFTWMHCAEQTLRVYMSILEKRR